MSDDDDFGYKKRPSLLMPMAELGTRLVSTVDAGTVVTLGYVETYDVEGRCIDAIHDEWLGSFQVHADGEVTATESDVYPADFGDAVLILRKAIESRARRVGDVELVEASDEGQPVQYLTWNTRLGKPHSFLDAYNDAERISRELHGPSRRVLGEIARVVAREIQSLTMDLSLDDYLELVEQAKTATEKGRALESLLWALFTTVPGFVPHSQNRRTASEEIDLVVINECKDAPWSSEGLFIPIECKNWVTRAGKNEAVTFYSKLENRSERASVGVFVAWSGVTKPFETELIRRSRGRPLVIVLTRDDIREAVGTRAFDSVLRRGFETAALR